MVAVQDFLSVGMTIIILCVVVACAAKLFQMATDIRESKELLRDICRNMSGSISPRVAAAQMPMAQMPMTPATQMPLPQTPMTFSIPVPPPVPSMDTPSVFSPSGTPPTAEELVRMIHAQSFKGEDFPV